MSEIELTGATFDKEVLQSNLPVIVDFWAEWCGPCKVLSPIVAEIAEEFAGKIKVGSVDVDHEDSLQQRYNVMSIPTLKFFKGGQIVAEIVGAAPKSTIVAELKKFL